MAYLTSSSPLASQLLPRNSLEAALYASLTLIFYLVGLALYRLYLVPQAKFPGPKLAALTYWYEYYYDVHLQGQFTFHVIELHKKYGPIVRINPYELHCNDPDFYGEIYHGNKWITHRDRWFNLDFLGDGLAFTLDHNVHRVRRDALAPYFSMQSIRTLEPRITVVVANMVTRLQQALQSGQVFDMYEVGSAFAMDVITEYSFGKEGASNFMLKPELGKAWADLAKNSIRMNPFARQFKWFMKTMMSVPPSLMAKASKGMEMRIRWAEDLRDRVKRIMDESATVQEKKRQGDETTMFHELIYSNLPPQDKTLSRLADEAAMVVGAGGETTAQIMARSFYHIIANPHVLKKLREELNVAIPDPTIMPTIQQLQQLPYLSAVVEEGCRIALPVPARSPRIFEDHALKYGEWTIEPGIAISTSPYVISTNETVFPEPFVFKPERWLGEAGKDLQKYAVTFGKGRRACLGKKYVATPFLASLRECLLTQTQSRICGTLVRDCGCISKV